MAITITKKDNGIIEATSDTSKYIMEIDREICVGAASCVAIAGQTFDLDGENKVVVLDGDWDDDDMIMAGAQSCPVFAIVLKDKATGIVVFPAV